MQMWNMLASTRHLSEVTVFWPMAVEYIAMEIHKLVTIKPDGDVEIIAQYLVIQGLTFALLFLRVWRSAD